MFEIFRKRKEEVYRPECFTPERLCKRQHIGDNPHIVDCINCNKKFTTIFHGTTGLKCKDCGGTWDIAEMVGPYYRHPETRNYRKNWEVQDFGNEIFRKGEEKIYPIRINTDCCQCNARHVIWLGKEDIEKLIEELKRSL